MADELALTLSFVYAGKANKNDGFSIAEKTYSYNQAGVDYTRGTQSIGTSAAEAIVVSAEIGTQGQWMVWNKNANTGVLKLGLSSVAASTHPIKIKPGDPPAIFRAGGAVYALASGAVVQAEFVCIEA